MKIITHETKNAHNVVVTEYVDFEAPIWMSDKQIEKFISFFKKMFPFVTIQHDVMEKSKEIGERESEIKKWTVNDYYSLLTINDNGSLAQKTGRTEMGIKMKRGHFVPEFMVWAKSKGYKFPIKKEMIKEFIKEQGEAE